MSLTTDRDDPRLGRGPGGVGQNDAYLVLSDEERARGFVRPVRTKYIHDACGVETRMNLAIAETYAREPGFYGATFCIGCNAHFPVAEFTWSDTDERVGS